MVFFVLPIRRARNKLKSPPFTIAPHSHRNCRIKLENRPIKWHVHSDFRMVIRCIGISSNVCCCWSFFWSPEQKIDYHPHDFGLCPWLVCSSLFLLLLLSTSFDLQRRQKQRQLKKSSADSFTQTTRSLAIVLIWIERGKGKKESAVLCI